MRMLLIFIIAYLAAGIIWTSRDFIKPSYVAPGYVMNYRNNRNVLPVLLYIITWPLRVILLMFIRQRIGKILKENKLSETQELPKNQEENKNDTGSNVNCEFIKIYCPSCHQKYKVSKYCIGRKAECDQCNEQFIISIVP